MHCSHAMAGSTELHEMQNMHIMALLQPLFTVDYNGRGEVPLVHEKGGTVESYHGRKGGDTMADFLKECQLVNKRVVKLIAKWQEWEKSQYDVPDDAHGIIRDFTNNIMEDLAAVYGRDVVDGAVEQGLCNFREYPAF